MANSLPSLFTNHLRSDGPFVPPAELSRHDSLRQPAPKKHQCQALGILYRGMWKVAMVPCISLKREDFSVHLPHYATVGRQMMFLSPSFRNNCCYLGKISVFIKKCLGLGLGVSSSENRIF